MKITLLTGKTCDFAKELGFAINIVKSPIARRLSLRIDEQAHLPVLTIPRYCSQKKALAFVRQHRDWICNMLARLPQREYFTEGAEISIAGRPCTIIRQPGHRGTELTAGKLIIGGDAEFLHRRVCDFLKKYAAAYLEERSRAAAAKIGRTVRKVTVKEIKSRWGSCSTKNNINYNWRIIMAPDFVIDYLICHEVSHLCHPDHSAAFWNCVASLCPNWQDGRRWLKVRGKMLYRWI